MINSIICFIVAFLSFVLLLPIVKATVFKFMTEYRMLSRIKRVKSKDAAGDDFGDEEAEDESIGLSQKGSDFGGVALFQWIAASNQDMIEEMKVLLDKAGIRQGNALDEFMKSKAVAALALTMIVFLILGTNDWGIPFLACIPLSLVIGVVGGHKLTNMNMEMLANKRKDAIEHGIPDLVDLLVICAESGLDLNRSIRRIAREMRTSNPTMADELSLTSIELEMIPDHRQVFENFEKRTDSLAIKTLSKTLSQSIEYGSSLAVTLRDLAVESRQKRMLDAEARAAQAPTLLTLPMMFFIMPCLFIVMLGPVIVGMVKSFTGG